MRARSLMSRGVRGGIAALGALALVGGASVGVAAADPAAPALPKIEIPGITTAASFTAPTCEATDWNPTDQQLTLTGSRLESYNAGNVVPMYGNWPETAYTVEPPVCGVRQVDGQPVAEWMYCTDAIRSTCSNLDGDGNVLNSTTGTPAGPMLPQETNKRLTDDQVKIVSYLLQHGIDWDANYPTYGGRSTRTDNSSQPNRQALQMAVWCVTDGRNYGSPEDAVNCDTYLSTAKKDEILALAPAAESVLDLVRTEPTPGDELPVGETAKFTLTTNLVDQPLALTVPAGATVEVCEGDAVIDGDTLTIAKTAGDTATVVLCVTSEQEGTVDLSVAGAPSGDKSISWNQSDADTLHDYETEGYLDCQVFATFDKKKQLTSAAAVTFVDEDGTGSGIVGSEDTGSLGLGSLGSLALGSLGLGSLGAGSLGDLGSADLGSSDLNGSLGGDQGSLGGSLGSTDPEGPSQPGTPEQPGQPEKPTTPSTPSQPAPDNGGQNNGQGNGGDQSGNQGPQGERPHAIDGGGAEMSTAAKTGAGLAIALLALGGVGAIVAVRRMRG
ncbi:hypothetical protein [Prescottella subtropica]|uniref:hypothetical protein n=1 Tax=Prescottella subtropica TaxID=2545757 RepID=UPI0010F8C9E5|nr:hypothetical protein [Prescottella subtropica]